MSSSFFQHSPWADRRARNASPGTDSFQLLGQGRRVSAPRKSVMRQVNTRERTLSDCTYLSRFMRVFLPFLQARDLMSDTPAPISRVDPGGIGHPPRLGNDEQIARLFLDRNETFAQRRGPLPFFERGNTTPHVEQYGGGLHPAWGRRDRASLGRAPPRPRCSYGIAAVADTREKTVPFCSRAGTVGHWLVSTQRSLQNCCAAGPPRRGRMFLLTAVERGVSILCLDL